MIMMLIIMISCSDRSRNVIVTLYMANYFRLYTGFLKYVRQPQFVFLIPVCIHRANGFVEDETITLFLRATVQICIQL